MLIHLCVADLWLVLVDPVHDLLHYVAHEGVRPLPQLVYNLKNIFYHLNPFSGQAQAGGGYMTFWIRQKVSFISRVVNPLSLLCLYLNRGLCHGHPVWVQFVVEAVHQQLVELGEQHVVRLHH